MKRKHTSSGCFLISKVQSLPVLRPKYETPEQKRREDAVMRRIAHSSRIQFSAIQRIEAIAYGVDFFCTTERGACVVEVKCRKKKYSSWLVAMHKVHHAYKWEQSKVPCYLAVHWDEDDTIYIARPAGGEAPTPYSIEWNGRTKATRGDPADMEPHARFSLKDLRKLT